MSLRHQYRLYYFSGVENRRNMTAQDYETQLQPIIAFNTAEKFWEVFLHLRLPRNMILKSKISIFKGDVKPMWELPEFQGGGRLFFQLALCPESEQMWQNLLLEFLSCFGGNEHYDEVVLGVEATLRQLDQLSICLWTTTSETHLMRLLFQYLKEAVPFYPNQEFEFSSYRRRNF